jgi:hypothetical protein
MSLSSVRFKGFYNAGGRMTVTQPTEALIDKLIQKILDA